ncbi:MAG: LacI family transcriptional regulator [Anaerolineae bacterium]|nr:LacI family transcriptional regulator [Anaerolineae bacterium]
MRRNQPTIRDVAAKAGVSHQTVSRVINQSERVLPDTRAKVEAAIQQLGYRPNAIARFMAHGRTHTLACLSPNLSDYTFARLIEGAETEARQHGYFLFSASAPDESAFADLIAELVDSRRTEGLLVFNPFADARHELLPNGVPTVFAGARPRSDNPIPARVGSVALNDVEAARIATRHLIDLGHTRIACFTGPSAEDCVQDRCQGLQEILQEAGISLDPDWLVEGDWTASTGFDALMHLSRLGKLPSAIFAQNDRIAIGAIRAARDLGINIPEQLSVIGVDDMPLASYFDPPLTTIRQDMFAIGKEAASLLIKAIEQPEALHQQRQLPAELIVRKSTAPYFQHCKEADTRKIFYLPLKPSHSKTLYLGERKCNANQFGIS